MMEVKAAELALGDVVQLFDGPYGTATVKQIKDGSVWFFRPYVNSEEWSYTGGVICMIGIEEFSRPIIDSATFKVWHRGEVDKQNVA